MNTITCMKKREELRLKFGDNGKKIHKSVYHYKNLKIVIIKLLYLDT